MKEFENNHHYSEQPAHQARSEFNRVMKEMERQGLNIEQRYLIKQQSRKIRKK